MSGVRAFFLTPTDRYRMSLRRYVTRSERQCGAGGQTGCDAMVILGVETHASQPSRGEDPERFPDTDPRWPQACERCGAPFLPTDAHQVFPELLYTRSDGGPETTLRDAPPGAMWDAPWMTDFHKGPDGRCLVARLPNGRDWMIDGEASNCTRPGDRSHNCWVRHGEPPRLTVDKAGNTCAAGAGSILSGDYHGFLRDGVFTP